MKVQLEQLDLLQPWPTYQLREGYHAIQVLVRIGSVPVGEVTSRPTRSRRLTPRRLRHRIARRLGKQVLRVMAREASAAGHDALKQLGPDDRELLKQLHLAPAPYRVFPKLLERHVLLEGGLPAPWPKLIELGRAATNFPMPPVTVIVCTRDRADQLDRCIRSLLQLHYPEFEILILDNSIDPKPTRQVCERYGVSYAREERPGLSIARNTAMAAARHRWIAFTDDDCRPEPNWLRELVRKLQDTGCRCVCGLVLPATLDNSAEIAFEIYGGLGRGYLDQVFVPKFLQNNRWRPAPTWNIGAGANMLLDGKLALELGGYDIDLGAGTACGCSEDTLLFYQILRAGHSIHYTPRAIVHHHHRSSPESLRKQIHNYAVGHAAYHVRCLWEFGDYRSLLQLVFHLPRWFWRNFWRAARGKTKYPRSIVPIEAKGTIIGAVVYPYVKLRRWLGGLFAGPSTAATSLQPPVAAGDTAVRVEPAAAEPGSTVQEANHHDTIDAQNSIRVA